MTITSTSAEAVACGMKRFSCACGVTAGHDELHRCEHCGARWEHAAPETGVAAERRRRRMQAEVEEARRTLKRARARYSRLRNELAALPGGEQQA